MLKAEEELGRELFMSLDAAQWGKALISTRAPSDIITATDERVDIGKPDGLPVAEMSVEQKALLLRLVEEFVNNVRLEIADSYMRKFGQQGIEKIHFAWAGSAEPRKGHYYRIHGPSLLIEYDNTQNDANHIHSVWRDLENDFGIDFLKRHYQESDRHRRE